MIQGYFMYLSAILLYLESKQPQLKLLKKSTRQHINPSNQSNEKFTGSCFDFKRSIPLFAIKDPKL